jgi:hypothetical protein
MSVYIKKTTTTRSQMNNLMMHLKFLEKQNEANPKVHRQKEIMRIR